MQDQSDLLRPLLNTVNTRVKGRDQLCQLRRQRLRRLGTSGSHPTIDRAPLPITKGLVASSPTRFNQNWLETTPMKTRFTFQCTSTTNGVHTKRIGCPHPRNSVALIHKSPSPPRSLFLRPWHKRILTTPALAREMRQRNIGKIEKGNMRPGSFRQYIIYKYIYIHCIWVYNHN